MKKQKLINSIKKNAQRQIEAEIQASVVKEMYGASKKEIKKLKKQILKELQTEMFAEKKSSKIRKKKKNKGLTSTFVHTNLEDITTIKEEVENPKETKEVKETIKKTRSKVFEYRGFKFDVDRMSSIVTGKSIKEEEVKSPKLTKSKKKEINDMHKLIGIRSHDHNNIPTPFLKSIASSVSYTTPFVGKTIVKSTFEEISEEKKEEITFFIEKLKKGIDKLKNSQKSINYRKKKDNIYTFSFSKHKDGVDDFSFNFNLDLNIYTLGAEINKFEFDIDGFKFDKGFVEILDMIAVLDTAGMSLRKYIDEISEINTSASEYKAAIKENLKNNVKAIRANAELESVIFDQRILNILKSNDIKTYGQLKKIEELTSLKGVGAKTAEKIDEIIKQ